MYSLLHLIAACDKRNTALFAKEFTSNEMINPIIFNANTFWCYSLYRKRQFAMSKIKIFCPHPTPAAGEYTLYQNSTFVKYL